MSDIRLKKITIETSPLIIQNGDITILNTTISDSMLNGSLVSNGGISISSTYEASSMSAGGSLTVGGGVGVMKSIYIGKNLNMDTSNGIIVVGGVTENRMYLDNISNKHFYISPDGVNRRFDLYDSMLYINITTSSLNSSTGALCIEGGVSINTTENVTNSSNGGALTVAGGVGIGRNLRVGGNAVITESLTTGSFVVQNVNSTNITVSNTIITNTIITNATCTNLLATNITSSGLVVTNIDFTNATNTNLLATNITSSGLVVTDIVSTNVTNSNLLTTNISSNNVIATNLLNTNITSSNGVITNVVSTNETNSNLLNTNITSSNAIITNVNSTNQTNTNLLNTNITCSNAVIINLLNTNVTSTNSVITNSIITNSTNSNLINTNITSTNAIITNIDSTNQTNSNLLTTNVSSTNAIITNIDSTNQTNSNLLTTNISSTNAIITNIASTNQTNSNLLTTNITCTNSIISNLSVTSSTISNLVNTNVTVSNAILTNATITSITNSNLLNTALTSGGARITNDIYIGGDQYISGVANYTSDNDSVINLYDNLNFKRFSLDKNMSSHDFSVSRYDSLGNELEKTFGISYSTGVITFNNTIVSSSILSASMVVNGGISIKTSRSAQSESDGGALTIAGGVGVGSNLYIGGDVFMKSTTQSVDVSTGSLIIKGGVAISKNLNVLGNTLIFGNLTVNGLTTSIDTTNTVIKDNLLVLNSGPAGSNDSGIIITRYQQDNDTDSGDVVNTTDPLSIVIPAQTGMSSTQIKLNSSASEIDNYYTNWWVKVSSGFSNNQVRKITSYSGSTKIATISSSWTTQNPSGGDQLKIYNKPIVGLIFNELNDRFEFGSTVQDPGKTNVSFTDYMPITFASASSVSTSGSSSATSGSVLIAGGIGISNSTDAESITNGGTFTTLGGASIGKTLYCKTLNVNGVNMTPNSGDIFTSITFNASNNQTTPNDITNLSFSSLVWGFDCYLTARVVATTNLYTHFHIRGVNKGTDWEIIKTYVGNDTGIEFYITTGGQLQYTTPNISGFVSCTFKARALVN
jgi:hypothetical protein